MDGESYVKVIIDTNFLITPFLLGKDLFSELDQVIGRRYKVVILDCVLNELNKMAEKGGKKGRLAKAALDFIKQKGFTICSSEVEGSVDDVIFEYAKKWRCIVATNDRILRKRLRQIGVPVVYLRQKSHLLVDEEIL